MKPAQVCILHTMAGQPIRLAWPDGGGGQNEIELSLADCLRLIVDLAAAVRGEGAARLGAAPGAADAPEVGI